MTAKNTEYSAGDFDRRPWGAWRVLIVGDGFVIKKIDVSPGAKLSLQSHAFRRESWTIIFGTGEVTLDDSVLTVVPGDVVSIPVGARHRIENKGVNVLSFIEVQSGEALQESDIVRYDDAYGRS